MLMKRVFVFRTGGWCLSCCLLLLLIAGEPMSAYTQSGAPLDFHTLSTIRDSTYRVKSEAFLASVYRYMSGLEGQVPQTPRSILTVPVVVHVMHLPEDDQPNDATSNLTNRRIQEAIVMLNDAFRNNGPFAGDPQLTNAGIPAADVEIEFCLVQTDSQGNPHAGINRVPTSLSNLLRDEECSQGNVTQDICLKNLSRWNTNDYLNIWVVNSICVDANGDCLINGYSFLPSAHGMDWDGIVIEAGHMGSTPDKTTDLIHEAGHYLGLLDTYHQGSAMPNSCVNSSCLAYGDGICDTPPDGSRAALDCSLGERINSCSTDADDTSANNPFSSDVEDIYENFMDDGAPGCRNSFTPMQAVRMRFALAQGRSSLLGNPSCKTTFDNVGFGEWIRPPVFSCDSLIRPQLELYNNGETAITSIDFWQRVNGLSPSSWTWTGNLAIGDTIVLDLPAKFLPVGRHKWDVRVLSVNEEGLDDDRSDNQKILNFYRLPGSVPITDYPVCEEVEFDLYDFESINWDGNVGFDVFPWANCLDTTGKYVLRYNSSGVWEGGAGPGADPEGTKDVLFSRPFDLTAYNQASFSFLTAWKESYPDRGVTLNVYVLPGCDNPAELVYTISADELNSSQTPFDPGIMNWVPADCHDWMKHEIPLDIYIGQHIRVLVELELESEFTQNMYLDQFCMDASIVCALPSAIPQQVGVYLADTACMAPDGWTHFWKYADSEPLTSQDVLLFSVAGLDSSQLALPASGVSMVLTPKAGKGGHDMSGAPYVRNSEGWFVAGRFWKLSPSAGNDSLKVRIYFNDNDLEDLASNGVAVPVGLPPLTIFRIGANPDPDQGHEGVTKELWGEYALNQLNTGQRPWNIQQMDGFYASEFMLSDWDGLGFGVSGEGRGLGPTYPPQINILEATQQQSDVILTWEVPRELLADSYQVWRKTDQQADFEVIGSVASIGNNWETQVYSFHDPSPHEGWASYYVAMTHEVPLVAYSDTVDVAYDLARLVNLYPNPSSGVFQMAVGSQESEPIHAGIYNASWQLIAEKTWRNNPGEEWIFDLSFAPPGVYFYVVRYMRNGALFDVRGKILLVPEG